jgi:thioredoxin reductase
MLGGINDGGNFQHAKALRTEIKKYGIEMSFDTKAVEITQKGVICERPDGEATFAADTIIYATGQRPLWEDAAGLSLSAPDFYMIGDCIAPRNIMNATGMAFSTARNIL